MLRSNLFITSIVVFVCTAVSWAEGVSAPRMLKVTPNDCFALAVTSGSDELAPAFNATIMGKIWNSPQTKTFVDSIKTQLLKKASAQEPNAREKFDTAMEAISVLCSRPAIIGGAIRTGDEPAYGFFIADVNAGAKARISALLAKLEAKFRKGEVKDVIVEGYKLRSAISHDRCDAPPESPGMPVYWGFAEHYFVFTINDANGLALRHLASPRSAVPADIAQVYYPGDAVGVYVNTEQLWSLFKTKAEQKGQTAQFQATTSIIQQLGFCGVAKIFWRTGFAGPNITANSLVSIKPGSPRTGLLACLRPADLSMFNIVDANAAVAAVWNFDLVGAYDSVMNAINAADANAYASANNAIVQAQATIKFNIRNDMLASLAGPATVYTMPAGATMENPSPGMIVVARLTDAPRFEKAMNSLGDFLASVSKGMMQNSAEPQSDGPTLHRWTIMPLAMMQIAPCWTAADNMFIFGTNPGLCKNAAVAAAAKQPGAGSFALTPTYKKAAARFPKDVLDVKYVNSRVQFMQTINQVQQFWPMATMGLTKEGITLPATLPDYSSFAKQMGPGWEYSWFDANGLRSHYDGPGVDIGLDKAGAAGVGLAIAMPALGKARQQARRTVSMSNLKQIGVAIQLYAADHNDAYPPDLNALNRYVPQKVLESPFKDKNFKGPSYIYIPDQSKKSSPDNVVAYENPAFDGQSMLVLHVDGHVQFMNKRDFQQALERTYKNLGKPVPPEISK
jgi:hypothetical protein